VRFCALLTATINSCPARDRARQNPRIGSGLRRRRGICVRVFFALINFGSSVATASAGVTIPPVPLVQRREKLPFRRRQLMRAHPGQDKQKCSPYLTPGSMSIRFVWRFLRRTVGKTPRGWTYLASASVTSLGGSALPFLARSTLLPIHKFFRFCCGRNLERFSAMFMNL